jgi:hypothetical protein
MVLACCWASALAAQNGIKSPDQFLPHRLGQQFTPHHVLVDYYGYLAEKSPGTMRLETYGNTSEGRPLLLATFSSPENLANLEQIRQNNLRLAGQLDGKANMDNPIAIVWISLSVHGNEPSGAESGLELSYKLAAQTDPSIREWLKNTVVIVDPVVNPDGYDRYTHWNRMASNLVKNAHPDAREHQEPWPGGRVNHYYFDLNRDWAWATQVETQQRLAVFQRWLPHVHPDVHEQGVDDPYYFAPAAEPMHDYITGWQRDFQTQIGRNHAQYFDQNGWLYFTKEVFDLFYPSYGDTYPMYNGSIGMTYEQAGGPRGGTSVVNSLGDTLRLDDRIEHHLTTCLSTVEVTSKNAKAVVENFRDYHQKSSSQPPGKYKTFVLKASNNPNKTKALCTLLDQHNIRYGTAGKGLSGIAAFDYGSGKDISASIAPNDIVISAYQPKAILVQVLFEPESRLQDSMTYDITAWSLPLAHGLEGYAIKERIEPKGAYTPYKAPEAMITASPYAWCVRRGSLAEARFVSFLLQKGVNIRTATKAFMAAEEQFAAGDWIINRADNRAIAADLDGMVKSAAVRANVPVLPIFSGFMNRGSDLGSESFHLVQAPGVAILYGEDVDANAYGHIWHYFEQELQYPITPINAARLQRAKLHDFGVLIVADGRYSFNDAQMETLKNWIKNGGRLILCEGAIRAFADKDNFALKSKEIKKDTTSEVPKSYAARERDGISDNNPGAIVRAKADNSHPLAYGLPDYYYSLKTGGDLYEMPEKGTSAIWLENGFRSFGFIGSRFKSRMKKTPIAVSQPMGEGEVVYFTDSPLFRSFWQQGKVLFANAVFY